MIILHSVCQVRHSRGCGTSCQPEAVGRKLSYVEFMAVLASLLRCHRMRPVVRVAEGARKRILEQTEKDSVLFYSYVARGCPWCEENLGVATDFKDISEPLSIGSSSNGDCLLNDLPSLQHPFNLSVHDSVDKCFT